jgi:hypothetical protein
VSLIHEFIISVPVLSCRISLPARDAAIGFVFYKSHWPERAWPTSGRFDLWAHSHQWWHAAVVAAVVAFDRFLRAIVAHRLGLGCAAAAP